MWFDMIRFMADFRQIMWRKILLTHSKTDTNVLREVSHNVACPLLQYGMESSWSSSQRISAR